MTNFTTFADESGRDQYFSVGGLTSTPEGWAALGTEWIDMLAQPPAIPFFKFSNPHRLSMKDHGAKIDAGIVLINKHVLRADASIVDIGEYEVYFKGLIGVGHDNPMLFAYMQTIMQAALHCPDSSGQINFIFDTMNVLTLADLQHGFEVFRETCPYREVVARLQAQPKCMDDKATVQLQAADLWVGAVSASMPGDKAAMDFLRKVAIPNRAVLWNQENLPELLSKSVKRTPSITSGKFYESKKQRKRRLKRWLIGTRDASEADR